MRLMMFIYDAFNELDNKDMTIITLHLSSSGHHDFKVMFFLYLFTLMVTENSLSLFGYTSNAEYM